MIMLNYFQYKIQNSKSCYQQQGMSWFCSVWTLCYVTAVVTLCLLPWSLICVHSLSGVFKFMCFCLQLSGLVYVMVVFACPLQVDTIKDCLGSSCPVLYQLLLDLYLLHHACYYSQWVTEDRNQSD